MGHATGAEKNLPLANPHHLPPLVFRFEVELDIAVDLIKKLLAGFDVKVQARVWPAEDHHDKFPIMREDAVGLERRPEEVPVLFDPGFEVG